MTAIKTLMNDSSAENFIHNIEHTTRREDALVLLEMFARITAQPAKMWGASIIGFGMYHYKSDRSAQEGDWPLVAFSPRKQSLSLYGLIDSSDTHGLLDTLGKYRTGKGCLYINKLADVDLKVLEQIIKVAYEANSTHYGQVSTTS